METSAKVGAVSVLMVVGVGLKLARLATHSSRHSTWSASSSISGGALGSAYGGSSFTSRRVLEELEERRLEREVAKAIADAKTALESTIERSCATTSRIRYLEPQGASLASLFRSSRRLDAPSDVRVPSAQQVMGLPVMVMARDGESPRWCVDATQGMANELVKGAPSWRSNVVEAVAPGAWVLHTTPGEGVPASTALVSSAFLQSLGPTTLVAMAPTDHTVAIADASKPEAVRAAAKKLAPLIDTSLGDGVLQAQPLVFKDGAWKPWTAPLPPEVAEVKKLAELAETRMALSLLDGFPRSDELEAFQQLGAGLPPFDFREGVTTTLESDEKRRTTVAIADLEEPTFVGQADSVSFFEGPTARTLSWAAFTKKYAAQLEPVKIDGTVVPHVVRLVPAVSR